MIIFVCAHIKADGAILTFHQPPVKLHYHKCNLDDTSDSLALVFPDCHIPEIDILSVPELYAESMGVD
jgi:hypothetical protein